MRAEYPSGLEDTIRSDYNRPGGLSSRQIAEAFGTTKGTVISIARQFGLQRSSGTVRKPRPLRAGGKPQQAFSIPSISAQIPPPPPRSGPISPHKECQWMGSGMEIEPICGQQTEPGYSWCSEHRHRVLVPFSRLGGKKDQETGHAASDH